MLPSNPIAVMALIALLFLGAKRLLTYLHIFQQEEYDNLRFLAWLRRSLAFDRRVSLAFAAGGIAGVLIGGERGQQIALGIGGLAALYVGYYEPDPRRSGKKPLNLTRRASRLMKVSFLLLVVLIALAALRVGPIGASTLGIALAAAIGIVLVQAIPIYLVWANLLLSPLEERINNRYLKEARAILAKQQPVVIGITGSYGKTSTKNILAHILSTAVPTLATPGSVNTPLGIARVVREQLKPHHRYFVVEMGAYGVGSIARLCDLTPPDFAAITAVGSAHRERFKTDEAVASAKFEIATATIARKGRVVLNAGSIPEPLRAPYVAQSPSSYVLVGADAAEVGAAGYVIEGPVQTAQGISFALVHQGVRYAIAAPIYGLHQADNIAVAFALAVELGVPAETAVAALRNLPQVPHRLQVTANPGKAIMIDDAYNANPVGFASALDVLDKLSGAERRRVLVTPGMVELGDRHDEAHRAAGERAGEVVDVALVIGAERIPSFVAAFEAGTRPGRKLVRLASFAEAKGWLGQNAGPGDAVLYENDLPDLYERRLKL